MAIRMAFLSLGALLFSGAAFAEQPETPPRPPRPPINPGEKLPDPTELSPRMIEALRAREAPAIAAPAPKPPEIEYKSPEFVLKGYMRTDGAKPEALVEVNGAVRLVHVGLEFLIPGGSGAGAMKVRVNSISADGVELEIPERKWTFLAR